MQKPFLRLLLMILLLTCQFPVNALEQSQPQTHDIVMQALEDEMARSTKRLKLNEHDCPYFVSYTVNEYNNLRILASCGAVTDSGSSRWRSLKVDVREGNYHLDSSNFSHSAGMLSAGLMGIGSAITADDDYDAMRHTIWLRTDAAYKTAIKNYEAKKSYLEQNNVPDRPDDFSQETSTTSIDKPLKLDVDSSRWQTTIKSVSAVFRQYPAIQRSVVDFSVNGLTDWFVNSEGSHIRQTENQYSVIVLASLQADDGMQLADSRVFCSTAPNDLPKEEELTRAVKTMADNLMRLKSAPLAAEYRGPILLEGQASAEFINQLLRYHLGHAQEVLSNTDNTAATRHNQFKDLVGQAILPPFISIIDDPLSERYHNQPLVGGHKIDEDGVPGQKVLLVDKGILKTFCTSRTPTLYTKHSNGHSIAGIGEASTLYINSDNQLNAKQMKDKLLELGKKAGLKSVMIARWLAPFDAGFFSPASLLAEARANTGGMGGGSFVRSPLFLYSITVADGHEELVRGAQFSPLSLRILRDIVCTGTDAKPWVVLAMEPGALAYYDLVAPSLLIGEIELHKPSKENDKLPILPNPLSEK